MGSSFTVFFDGTFWVGVVEVAAPDGSVRAARHVFGNEPTNAELLEFVRRDAGRLIDTALAGPAVPGAGTADGADRRPRSARRGAREAGRNQDGTGPSDAARAALELARLEDGQARRDGRRQRREEADQVRRELRAQRRRARHRGR